jgi:signal transduction histidine kinase
MSDGSDIYLKSHRRGLRCACHVLPDVPDDLLGDATRLRQILINLVGNAIKFTAKAEVVVRVEIESETDAEAVLHFSVTDTGVGVPKDNQQTIFDAFTQADSSTTRKFGGTGLGLTICSRLESVHPKGMEETNSHKHSEGFKALAPANHTDRDRQNGRGSRRTRRTVPSRGVVVCAPRLCPCAAGVTSEARCVASKEA